MPVKNDEHWIASWGLVNDLNVSDGAKIAPFNEYASKGLYIMDKEDEKICIANGLAL